MRLIDEQFLATPYYGSRQMVPLAELPMATSENYFAGQVILVGYGRVGKRIANLLFEKNIPYVWSQMKIEG